MDFGNYQSANNFMNVYDEYLKRQQSQGDDEQSLQAIGMLPTPEPVKPEEPKSKPEKPTPPPPPARQEDEQFWERHVVYAPGNVLGAHPAPGVIPAAFLGLDAQNEKGERALGVDLRNMTEEQRNQLFASLTPEQQTHLVEGWERLLESYNRRG